MLYYFDRLLRTLVFITISAVFFAVPIFITSLFSPSVSYFISRWWFALVFSAYGIELEVENSNSTKIPKFIGVANHRSFLDIPAISLAINNDIRFIAKESLVKIPFIGWALKLQKHPLLGETLTKALLLSSKKVLSEGKSLIVFPEGTRGEVGTPLLPLLPIKQTVFHFIDTLGVEIIPIAIIGTEKIMPPKAIIPRSGRVKVKIGKPLSLTTEIPKTLEKMLK